MTGRFNQDLPENLQMAFEKATNFEPQDHNETEHKQQKDPRNQPD